MLAEWHQEKGCWLPSVFKAAGGGTRLDKLKSRIAERQKEEGGPTTGERKWSVLQMELPKREHLQKGIPKKGLTEIKLAVGGKDVKAAN